MTEAEYNLTGFSQDSKTYFDLINEIDPNFGVFIEIGTGYGQFVYDLYHRFEKGYFYSVDTLDVIINHPEKLVDLCNLYDSISDRATFIISRDLSRAVRFEEADFVFIDIGSNSDNILSVIKSINSFKNIVVMVPRSTPEKVEHRNRVLDYLRDNDYNFEEVKKTSSIRIFNEQ